MSELSKEGVRLSDIAFNTSSEIYNSDAGLSRTETAELVTKAIIEAVEPYVNLVREFMRAFPALKDEYGEAIEINGADAVDLICEMHPRFEALVK